MTYTLSSIEIKALNDIALLTAAQISNDFYTNYDWFIYAEKLAKKNIIATITFRTAINTKTGLRELTPLPLQKIFYKTFDLRGIGIWLPYE